MEDICNMPPQSKEDLILIKGIGKKKMEDYGDDILEMCKGVKGIVIEEKQTKVCEPNPLPENIDLSEEQEKVIDIYDKGENLFMTGPGGVGKSLAYRQARGLSYPCLPVHSKGIGRSG